MRRQGRTDARRALHRIGEREAFVLRDKALSGTLIGMSFLKRLDAYSAEGDRLQITLQQASPNQESTFSVAL